MFFKEKERMTPPPPPASKIVKIARDGAEIGEYKYELIAALLEAGVLKKTDHFWMQGMAGWLSLNQFSPPVVSIPQATKAPSGKAWWLIGGFFMPYFFAWRIIFDKTFGFTKTTKIIYAVWTACVLLPVIMPQTSSGYSRSEQTDDQESKNRAFMARLTPEQRIAMRTFQNNMRQALRENFDYQDSNKDEKLDVKEFLSPGIFKSSYGEADFEKKDVNGDRFLTFEEYSK